MTGYTLVMGNDFYPLFRIFEAMTFILIILAIAIGYWLIKGWVNVVNFIFNPLIAKSEKKRQLKNSTINVRRTAKSNKELSNNKNSSKNNIVSLEIDSIIKRENSFDVNIKLKNISNDPFFYKLGECYFAAENSLQIQGDTLRLINIQAENTNRILPYLHIIRRITFYDKYVDFSENDMIVCEVKINNSSHLLTSNLKNSNVKKVQLVKEMV